MLRTKSILAEPEASDGLRICVMSRLTKNNGVDPDDRLPGRFDEHDVILAPPPRLIGDYYHRQLSWVEFVRRFLVHLHSPEVHQRLVDLTALARHENVTLLCIEDDPERCHRRLLVLYCLTLDSDLEISIA